MGDKPLSQRKRKYIKGVAAGKTKRQAAIDAGYSEATAENAKAVIETPDVRAEFQRLIREAIPSGKIVQRLAEGVDAMETRFFQNKGAVVETRDVIAWSERRAYLELATEYGGYFIPKQEIEVNDKSDGGSRLAAILASAASRVGRVHDAGGKGGS